MKSSVLVGVIGLALAAAAAGCNKPSEDGCRKAIANMRSLLGTDSAAHNVDTEGDVRRCKGGSSREAVECASKATSLDELRACKFMKVPERKPEGSAGGGSAGSGSAPAPAPAPPAGSGSSGGT